MVETLLIVAAVLLALYAAAVLAFVAAGRRTDAAAFARFAPDRVVLIRRLLADPRVPARSRLALGAVPAYLVLPFDVAPTSSRSPPSSTTHWCWRSSCTTCCARPSPELPTSHNDRGPEPGPAER